MISGAGSTPLMARPSTNSPSVSQCWPSTAVPCRYGITVYAPPKVTRPALSPPEDLGGKRKRQRAGRNREKRVGGKCERVCSARAARGVCPQLVGESGTEQYKRKARGCEHRQSERGDGEQRQRNVRDERMAQPHKRAGHNRPYRRRQPVEQLVEVVGKIGLGVQDGQRQHQDKAGQHEAEPREEAAELATTNPAEVDAQLVRLGPREYLIDGKRLLERLLVDPVLLVDALTLDHRDLRRRSTPREPPEPQEPQEDRARRVALATRSTVSL